MNYPEIICILLIVFSLIGCDLHKDETNLAAPEPITSFTFSSPATDYESEFDSLTEMQQLKLFQQQQMEAYRITHLADTVEEADRELESWLAEDSDLPEYFRNQFAAIYLLNLIQSEDKGSLPLDRFAFYALKLADSGSPELAFIYNSVDHLLASGALDEAMKVAEAAVSNNVSKMMNNSDCFSCTPEELKAALSDSQLEKAYQRDMENKEAFLALQDLIKDTP